MKTTEQKIEFLRSYGYVVGERDPRLNTNYPGNFMVAEAYEEEDYELPTRDGRDGPWCIVGNDLTKLVNEAYKKVDEDIRWSKSCA